MNIKFVNLEPAFNGVCGWITISELYAIDPTVSGAKFRFLTSKEEWIAHDGTIFVFAFPRLWQEWDI